VAVYDAFVSYSHAKDKPIAAALQSVIQRLGKPWYRRRALRVFRDDTSLSATPSLWPSIEQALGNSRFLILLASPEAATSPWVNKEISFWLDHKSADTLLIALTDGELAWDNTVGDFVSGEDMPLPPVLTGRLASEPKWVDVRGYRDGADARDARFIDAGADFAAAIRGMPKEDLLSQEVRQQRRALTLAWSAAGTLAVLIALAGWQWWEAEGAKRSAQRERDRAETNFGIAKSASDHVVFRIAQDLRDVQGMRVESVRQILDTARSMMDELARAAPDDLRLQRSRSVMLNEFAETYVGAGDLTRAQSAADESLVIARKLAATDLGNTGWQHDVSVSLERLGDVRLAAGDRAAALAAYEEGLTIRRKLAAADPGNARWQREVSVSLEKLGDARLAEGGRAGALAAYQEGLTIRRKLAATDPGNAGWQRDLSVNLDRMGDLQLAAGEARDALAAYEESLAIARKLAAADPGNAGWQRDIGVSLNKVGDVRLAAGDRAGALAAYEEGLTIRRKLAAADPGNAGWQRDVGVTLVRVGDARRAAGDAPGALVAYEESLGIARRLAAADPGNAGWQRDVSVSLIKIGEVRLAAGDRNAALTAYEESLVIIRKLAAADPGNAGWQRDLGVSLERAGDTRLMTGARPGALAAYEEGLAIRRRLAAADPDITEWQADLVVSLYKLSIVSDPPRAHAALREALTIVEALARHNKLTAAQKNWPQLIRDLMAKLPPEAVQAQ